MQKARNTRQTGRIRASILIAAVLLLFPASRALAAVAYPQIDVITLDGASGVSNVNGWLTIEGTTTTLFNNAQTIALPHTSFDLTAQYAAGWAFAYSFSDGTFNIDGLLTGSFDSLTLISLGGGVGQFFADLTYTGGPRSQGIDSGRIEGSFFNATGADFAANFNADTLHARLGPVHAPIPPSMILLASGLLGLVMLRKKSVR